MMVLILMKKSLILTLEQALCRDMSIYLIWLQLMTNS